MEVLSTNLFDLLGDDEGGDAPVVKPAASAQKDAKKAPQKKEAAVARSDKKPNDRPIRNEYPRRGGFQQRGGAVEGAPRTPRNRDNGDFEPREGRDHERGERGGFRGGRGTRGRGGFRGREFDRRSGTGRVDGVKKEVAGKGSWGNPLTAEEEAKKELQENTEGTPEVAEGAEAENPETPAVEAEENKEPEEVLKTLDQYFAEKQKPSTEINIRKPNEGADDAQWKDAVVLKKEDVELFAELTKPGKKKAVSAKEKAQKAFVNIDQRFADEQRGGYGRGRGRGEFRGRGGERNGNRRSGQGRNSGAVNVEDQTAFPSLGSK